MHRSTVWVLMLVLVGRADVPDRPLARPWACSVDDDLERCIAGRTTGVERPRTVGSCLS